MVLTLAQTRSAWGARYQVIRGNGVLWEGEAPWSMGFQSITLTRMGEPVYRMTGRWLRGLAPQVQNTKGIKLYGVERPDGTPAGEIGLFREKGWHKPSYFRLYLEGREWRLYEVGLGKEGLKLPVWREGRQVALLEKDSVVVDNLDRYDMFLLTPEDTVPTALLGLYYDFMRFGNRGEYQKGKSVSYIYTRNRDVLAKYDPAFRALCAE